jgi:predicted amidohydrolase YtcJ
MFEAAAWQLVNPLIPRLGPLAQQEALCGAIEHANGLGLTTVGSMEYARDVEAVHAPIRDDLLLRIRVTLLDREWPLDFSFGEEFAGDDFLDVIGYKTFLDGTLGARTARMLEDYADDPGNRGMWCELADSRLLPLWIQAVAQRGFQPSMHAIGDAAARAALDAIDSVPKDLAECVRPRIEHAQQLHLSDIKRFKRPGTIASMQPLHRADDGRYALRRMGPQRIDGTFAFRRLKDAGAHLAFGSDWPIVSCDPFAGIRAAVTGLTLDGQPFCADQNLTVEESLRAYTIEAAHALHFESAVGSIEVGKCADLVILDRDPFDADWVNDPPRALMTIVDGEIVHDAVSDAVVAH